MCSGLERGEGKKLAFPSHRDVAFILFNIYWSIYYLLVYIWVFICIYEGTLVIIRYIAFLVPPILHLLQMLRDSAVTQRTLGVKSMNSKSLLRLYFYSSSFLFLTLERPLKRPGNHINMVVCLDYRLAWLPLLPILYSYS